MSDPVTPAATETTPTTPALETPAPIVPVVPTTKKAPLTKDDIPRELLDSIEAEHKRGLQQQLREKDGQLAKLEVMRKQVAELMPRLPEGTDYDDVASGISSALDAMKTEREKMDAANKTQAEKLVIAEKDRDSHLKNLHSTVVNNVLAIELGPKAVSPNAAKMLARELAQYADASDGKTVVFDMNITDENGHTAKQKVGVKKAVETLEANKDEWGFAFKPFQTSGVDGETSDGFKRTTEGEVDIAELAKDPEKFFALYKDNPELLAKLGQTALSEL